MARLDKSRAYGEMRPPEGGAHFVQNGRFFDHAGHEVPEPGKPRPKNWTPDPDDDPPPARPAAAPNDPVRLAALEGRERRVTEREEAADAKERALTDREQEIDAKKADLDEREAALAKREAAIGNTAPAPSGDGEKPMTADEVNALPVPKLNALHKKMFGKGFAASDDQAVAEARKAILAQLGHAA